jgi:transposase
MKAYSTDLRERVILAVNQGMPQTEIAKVFAISLSTIKRYLKQWRETATLDAKPIPGRPSKKLEPLEADLSQMLATAPDATLEQHCQTWERMHAHQGESLDDEPSHQATGLDPKKKTLGATERNEAARRTWREQMKQVDATKLVIVDETGSNIGLTPLYAWAPRGKRAYGSVPRNYGKNTTLLASLSLFGMGAAMILEGASDTMAFEYYVEHILAPSLKPGQIVLMDNLSSHTGPKVRQAIEAKGCQLLFLPAYSPDLSPIEEAFSKLKAFLRRVGARTHEDLWQALCDALETITPQDALGWFTHCGYFPADQVVS